MHFHAAGLPRMGDSLAQAEARRKATKSISRTTGKPVAESATTLTVGARLGAIGQFKGSFTSPPQIDDARAYELARLQMMGFFYFLTYDSAKNVGHYWLGDFYPVHGTIKSDWGNAVHRAFMKGVAEWDYRLILTTASGYYRAVIRRHSQKECWSWAIEWNDCYRLIGFFGDLAMAKEIVDRFPNLPVHSVLESSKHWLRYRREDPLQEDEDMLFSVSPESQ